MIKLKANNSEDLKVVASLVQDSILPIGDFAYFKAEKKVMFALNRYCWENETDKKRCNAVLTVLNVDSVQTKNIDVTDRKQSLYVLDISEGEGEVVIAFADNKSMKFSTESLDLSLVDVDDCWVVETTPSH